VKGLTLSACRLHSLYHRGLCRQGRAMQGLQKEQNKNIVEASEDRSKGEQAMFDEILENLQDVIAFGALSVFTVTVLVWGNVIVELARA
jgi:hypothetical protein